MIIDKEVLKQMKALGVTRKAGQQLTCTGLGSFFFFFFSRKTNRGDCLKIKESLICLEAYIETFFSSYY